MAENKRKAGRPRKDATPTAKRAKTAPSPVARAATPKEHTSQVVEVVIEAAREATPLPNRVTDSNDLPTLSEPQRVEEVADDEYQSIGAR